jgi:hypothetical protein
MKGIARAFLGIAELLVHIPVWKRDDRDPSTFRHFDISNASRLQLLLEWYAASEEGRFIEVAIKVAEKPAGGFSAWDDSTSLVRLISDLRNGSYARLPESEALCGKLEDGLVDILNGHLWPEDLDRIYDALEGASKHMPPGVMSARDRAVIESIDNLSANIGEIDSESTLEDHKKALERYAPVVGIKSHTLQKAFEVIDRRIAEINDESDESPTIRNIGEAPQKPDKFDDAELSNLFAPLLGTDNRSDV